MTSSASNPDRHPFRYSLDDDSHRGQRSYLGDPEAARAAADAVARQAG